MAMIRRAPWAAVRSATSIARVRTRGMADASTIPTSKSLLIASPPGLRVIDLHRPEALNALNGEMVATLLPLVQDWQKPDGDVKLVVFRGSGKKAFCAGGDIRFLHDCASADAASRVGAYDFFRKEYTLNHAIGTSRIPFVSLIEGIVMGGGVGLSVHGAFRVATESTTFAMPETGIGFFPDVGGSYFLPRLRGELGTYLGLTGARLKGRDVLAAGVATHFVSGDSIAMLEGVLSEFGVKASKGVDGAVLSSALGALDQLTSAVGGTSFVDEHAGDIDACFGHSEIEAITDAVRSTAASAGGDKAHWAVRAEKDLQRASPTSLAVTLEALRRGKAKTSLGECLTMEFRIAQRFMRHTDFVSGVGAVLTKGAEPASWAPPPAKDEINEFFEAGEAADLEL